MVHQKKETKFFLARCSSITGSISSLFSCSYINITSVSYCNTINIKPFEYFIVLILSNNHVFNLILFSFVFYWSKSMDGIVFHPCPFWNPGVAGTFPSLVEKYERSFYCHHRLTDKYGSCSVLPSGIRRVGIRHNDRACGRRRGPAGIRKCASRFPSDALEQASRPLI